MMKLQTFNADSNLLYLIQQVTKQSSADILNYFYSTAMAIIETSLVKSTAQYPRRKLKMCYPNTAIPFQLEVWYNKYYKVDGQDTQVTCNVVFPKIQMHFNNLADIANQIAEAHLLGGKEPKIDPFEAPALRAPGGMRNLIREQKKNVRSTPANS